MTGNQRTVYNERYKEKCFDLVTAYDFGGSKNITKRLSKGFVSGKITEPRTAKYEKFSYSTAFFGT